MDVLNFSKRLALAIRRDPWQLVVSMMGSFFVGYTVCWGVVAPIYGIASPTELKGLPKYLAFVVISLVVGFGWFIRRHVPKTKVSSILPSTNTRLSVSYGDFFSENGHKVIAVSEFFDGEIGEIVSPNSLHGQFIAKYCQSQSSEFYALVDSSLASVRSQRVERPKGRNEKFPIGTTAVGRVGSDRYFFVAMTNANPITHKVAADVPQLWQALNGLWSVVRDYANEYPVVVPLIGGGASGVGLPNSVLLNLILTSVVNETKKRRIAGEIKVVLYPGTANQIDLRAVEMAWS